MRGIQPVLRVSFPCSVSMVRVTLRRRQAIEVSMATASHSMGGALTTVRERPDARLQCVADDKRALTVSVWSNDWRPRAARVLASVGTGGRSKSSGRCLPRSPAVQSLSFAAMKMA